MKGGDAKLSSTATKRNNHFSMGGKEEEGKGGDENHPQLKKRKINDMAALKQDQNSGPKKKEDILIDVLESSKQGLVQDADVQEYMNECLKKLAGLLKENFDGMCQLFSSKIHNEGHTPTNGLEALYAALAQVGNGGMDTPEDIKKKYPVLFLGVTKK